MKLKLAIDPDIVALMAAEVAAGERAVTAAMREAGTGLKSAWRTQITGAGLGTRLANSIRSASFPKSGESLNAAALVWSNAPVIIGAHDTGPLIRSKNGFWLAIPTPAAGKSTRGGRITPGEWERRTGLRLRFIYRRRGPSLLVAEGRLNTKGRAVASRSKTGRGVVTAPIFLLVPQVKLPKRLDLARDAERAVDGVPGLIVANWVEGLIVAMGFRAGRTPLIAANLLQRHPTAISHACRAMNFRSERCLIQRLVSSSIASSRRCLLPKALPANAARSFAANARGRSTDRASSNRQRKRTSVQVDMRRSDPLNDRCRPPGHFRKFPRRAFNRRHYDCRFARVSIACQTFRRWSQVCRRRKALQRCSLGALHRLARWGPWDRLSIDWKPSDFRAKSWFQRLALRTCDAAGRGIQSSRPAVGDVALHRTEMPATVGPSSSYA